MMDTASIWQGPHDDLQKVDDYDQCLSTHERPSPRKIKAKHYRETCRYEPDKASSHDVNV